MPARESKEVCHNVSGFGACLRGNFNYHLIGVAQYVNARLRRMKPPEGQASDQPGVAGRDVK